MTRIMRDSTTAADIRLDGLHLAAGYVNGLYAWGPADWALFAPRPLVRISIAAVNAGDVLDVEQGDALPAEAPGWAAMRRAAGVVEPCVYCSRANFGDVQRAFAAAGVPEPLYWLATLDGTRLQLGGRVIACQYAGESITGGHYDESIVADYWPGIDPAPAGPPPTPAEVDDMGLRIEPPFAARFHSTGAHWSAGADGSGDQGPADIAEGTALTIVEVSGDGKYVRPDLGAWWLPSSTVGVLLGGGGPAAGAVPPHSHSGSVTVQ